MTSSVEINKSHCTKQLLISAKCEDALRVVNEISFEIRFRNLNTGYQPVAHIGERWKVRTSRRLHLDFSASGQDVEIVPCGESGPFHNLVVHLSSLQPVS